MAPYAFSVRGAILPLGAGLSALVLLILGTTLVSPGLEDLVLTPTPQRSARPSRLNQLPERATLADNSERVNPFLIIRRLSIPSNDTTRSEAPPVARTVKKAGGSAFGPTVLREALAQAGPVKEAASSTSDPITPGMILHLRYRIIAWIGGRAEGDALEAWDLHLNRSVLAKCFKEGKTVEYTNEYKALSKLITSPVFGKVYGSYFDSFLESGRQCIVQPYLGSDLAHRMRQTGEAYSVEQVINVLYQMMEQLEAAHHSRIAHFDVKLDNLVFADREEWPMNGSFPVQLIDWGQSVTDEEGNLHKGKHVWQVYRVHPPERVLQLPASYPLDMWASGIVALHMLTRNGQFPDVIKDTESIASYLNKIETLAGCIPAYLLPRDWNHKSDLSLHVQDTILNRIKTCSKEPGSDPPVLVYLTTEHTLMRTPRLVELSDLLAKMLQISPAARITAAAALRHPVFSGAVQ